MNAYGVIILAALLLEWTVNLAADVLNLRALDPELPEEARDIHDAEAYRRSQAYTRARTRFGLLSSTVNLAALLVFWFAGGFPALDGALARATPGPISAGLAFMGSLALAQAILDLPFRLYSTFVIENRFGFNRTTPRTFVADLGKGMVLAVAVGAPLVATILYVFQHAGPWAWLYGWGITTAALLGVQFVAPTWIMPLFNTFTPLADGVLREAILAHARSAAFPLSGVFLIDGSRRTTKANAFFTGFGSTKRIALFDTLVERQPVDQVVAVVAHEIGHYKLHHIPKNLGLAILHTGVLFALLSVFLSHDGLFAAFGVERPSVHAGLVFFGLLYTPVELGLGLILNALSRRDEYAADRFAAETTGRPESLAAGLKRLASEQLANLTPHPIYVALNHSHPPLLARLAALRRIGRGDIAAARTGPQDGRP
jgi:STE24 endopeptidase